MPATNNDPTNADRQRSYRARTQARAQRAQAALHHLHQALLSIAPADQHIDDRWLGCQIATHHVWPTDPVDACNLIADWIEHALWASPAGWRPVIPERLRRRAGSDEMRTNLPRY